MWPACGRLAFPVGLIDLPFKQRQEPLVLDFARKHGNLAVVGAPQTGKSSLLRTLMLSAMLTHTPAEIQFYCIDYGGGTLAPLAGAPHVGAVAGRRDPQTAQPLLSEMLRLITAREQLFAEQAIDSLAAFRGPGQLRAPARRHRARPTSSLVIDNWGAVRAEPRGRRRRRDRDRLPRPRRGRAPDPHRQPVGRHPREPARRHRRAAGAATERRRRNRR